jgi:hypothetical protein
MASARVLAVISLALLSTCVHIVLADEVADSAGEPGSLPAS